MPIEVTIRHLNAGAGLKEYAELRAEKLMQEFPRVESVHAIIDVQRHLYEAEFVVQQKGLTAVGAKEHAASANAAMMVNIFFMVFTFFKRRARLGASVNTAGPKAGRSSLPRACAPDFSFFTATAFTVAV